MASQPGHAEIKLSSVTTGSQGKVDIVPPRAIHAEQGGPTRSVAIILRTQKLGEGTVLQRRFDPQAKDRGRAIRADARSPTTSSPDGGRRRMSPGPRANTDRRERAVPIWAAAASVAQAQPAAEFKTLNILVGSSVGGGYDMYARILARHMPRYLAGQPNIVVQNMPGASKVSRR